MQTERQLTEQARADSATAMTAERMLRAEEAWINGALERLCANPHDDSERSLIAQQHLFFVRLLFMNLMPPAARNRFKSDSLEIVRAVVTAKELACQT